MANEVFLDSAFAIALSSPSDEFHQQAILWADQLQKSKTRLVTTRAVCLEIGNALAKLKYRQAAIKLLRSIENDPNIEITALSEELYRRAFQLYQERRDKEWGLTDCISFTLMQNRGIHQALTTDEHFQQIGFRVLLREQPQ
ncbi:MAG: type II toxin-antitoxin system VapC family toxin [Chloroflexi bacterium]|nr:type II toxin-antitoxin system VapC family toxin [Chloroflexota bacterium]